MINTFALLIRQNFYRHRCEFINENKNKYSIFQRQCTQQNPAKDNIYISRLDQNKIFLLKIFVKLQFKNIYLYDTHQQLILLCIKRMKRGD